MSRERSFCCFGHDASNTLLCYSSLVTLFINNSSPLTAPLQMFQNPNTVPILYSNLGYSSRAALSVDCEVLAKIADWILKRFLWHWTGFLVCTGSCFILFQATSTNFEINFSTLDQCSSILSSTEHRKKTIC